MFLYIPVIEWKGRKTYKFTNGSSGRRPELWKESYAKAHEMVREMTLAEKVNVTTGTGWQMCLHSRCTEKIAKAYQYFQHRVPFANLFQL
jgi:hypothetical protein